MRTTDRSRIESYLNCPRKRYWSYEYDHQQGGALGLEPAHSQAVDLIIGSAVHLGIERLRQGQPLEAAVGAALLDHQQHSIIPEIPTPYAANAALVEALVRGYARTLLPAIDSQYEIVDVEREEELELAPGLLFLARPDALLRRRSDGELFVDSLKTVSNADATWAETFRYDIQTMSEVAALEARLRVKLSGVLVEGLVKGQRKVEWPRGSGLWHPNSPLLWAWRDDKTGATQARYEWIDEAGLSRRLGRGWQRTPAWELEGGIAGWLEKLAVEEPGLVEEQFILLPPILRSAWEMTRWRQQAATVEGDVAAAVDSITAGGTLEETFVMHSGRNCLFPSRCSCFSLCHGTAAESPLESGYQPRRANHPRETELVQIQTGGVQHAST